ncbi:MAG: hypothetical protein ACYC2I_04330 [Elusimicrobiales bacterium]
MKRSILIVFAALAAGPVSGAEWAGPAGRGLVEKLGLSAPAELAQKPARDIPAIARTVSFRVMAGADKYAFLRKVAESGSKDREFLPGSGLSECWSGPSLEVGGVPVRQVCCLSTMELGRELKTPEMFCYQDAGAKKSPRTRGPYEDCVNYCIDEWLGCPALRASASSSLSLGDRPPG